MSVSSLLRDLGKTWKSHLRYQLSIGVFHEYGTVEIQSLLCIYQHTHTQLNQFPMYSSLQICFFLKIYFWPCIMIWWLTSWLRPEFLVKTGTLARFPHLHSSTMYILLILYTGNFEKYNLLIKKFECISSFHPHWHHHPHWDTFQFHYFPNIYISSKMCF